MVAQAAEVDELFMLFGKAVARWQDIEGQLAATFGMLVNPDDMFMGVSIFHTPTNFRIKLALLDTAVRHRFASTDHDAVLSHWTALCNKISRKQKRRNALAHAATVTSLNDGEVYLAKGPFGFSDGEKFTAKQLKEIDASFLTLMNTDIAQFNLAIMPHLVPRPKSTEPLPTVTDSRTLPTQDPKAP